MLATPHASARLLEEAPNVGVAAGNVVTVALAVRPVVHVEGVPTMRVAGAAAAMISTKNGYPTKGKATIGLRLKGRLSIYRGPATWPATHQSAAARGKPLSLGEGHAASAPGCHVAAKHVVRGSPEA